MFLQSDHWLVVTETDPDHTSAFEEAILGNVGVKLQRNLYLIFPDCLNWIDSTVTSHNSMAVFLFFPGLLQGSLRSTCYQISIWNLVRHIHDTTRLFFPFRPTELQQRPLSLITIQQLLVPQLSVLSSSKPRDIKAILPVCHTTTQQHCLFRNSQLQSLILM